jgi:hypothetical protein
MATGAQPMVDERRTIEARATVRRVRTYWYRAGVPRRTRRAMTEELRAHLLEAVDEGRRIDDVVGDDLAAFASEWAQAERPRPLLDVFLQLVAMATLLPGALALLNPWFQSFIGRDDSQTGISARLLLYLAIIIPVIIAWQLVRVSRHRLTTQQTAILGVVLYGAYTVAFVAIIFSQPGSDAFATLPIAAPVAWTLVLGGTAIQAVASWLKRRR